MTQPTVIIIVGPTAAGKTAAAIRLAQHLHTDIISADSRQCFKELRIGVARPSADELAAVHHYFIGSHSIHEEVTAATFESLALGWVQQIFAERAPFAVMVGGTGLYIKAFCEGLDDIPPIDPAIRRTIQQQYESGGLGWLQDQVREQDPAFFSVGEKLNPQRLMRALEVKAGTGESILYFRTRSKKQRPFNIIKIGLGLPRELLYERINDRVDDMMRQGLLEEARGLLPERGNNALLTVGYRELFDHFDGKCTLEAAVDEVRKNTRHYAKRQMTWFSRDPAVIWADPREWRPENITQG